jgi:hypothetical protein
MKCFLILGALLISSFGQANEEQDFDEFMASFYQDFSQRQLKRASEQYFHQDAQFVFGEHVMVPGSAVEIEAVFQSIIESLEEDGYQKSVIRDIAKTYSGNTYVVATVYFDRYKSGEEKLDSMCSTYSAVRLAGEWKILTWLPSKPQKESSCF